MRPIGPDGPSIVAGFHWTGETHKFGVPAAESNRRVRLANDALRRGAVSIGDLREAESPEAG